MASFTDLACAAALTEMTAKRRFTRVQELIHELRVGDAMTPDVVVVQPECSMKELRRILRGHRISGAPVVKKGKLSQVQRGPHPFNYCVPVSWTILPSAIIPRSYLYYLDVFR